MGPILGRLVSSTFDKERMTPHSEFSPGTASYYFFINLGLDLGRDMK